MFTKEEINQLKKYVKGDVIQKEDSMLIENLQSIGLATSGFHQEGNEIYETSGLTSLGYSLFKSSKIRHNPIRNFFSGLIASTY